MKKLTAIFIICCFLLAYIPALSYDSLNPEYDNETAFLKAIGLITNEFIPEEKISKAEFLSIVMTMLFKDTDFAVPDEIQKPFYDVDISHPFYGTVKAAKDLGIVQGNTGALFMPDSEINFDIALTILLNSLNYKLHAQSAGGYPSGYLYTAKQIGILKEITITQDTITKAEAAKLIYNSLFTSCVVTSELTENGFNLSVDASKTVLWEKFKIKEYDAQIVDNGFSSLYGNSIQDEKRIVLKNLKNDESILAFISDSQITNLLGYRIKAFVKFDTETYRNEIVYYNISKNVKTVSLNASDIFNISNGTIEYETDTNSGKYQKYNIGQTPTVVLNDTCYYTYNTITDVIPKDGIITLIDNNSDGRYEILSILSFNVYTDKLNGTARNIVVDRINTENDTIYCKLNAFSNLSLDDTKCTYKILSDTAEITSLSDIKAYDIISVAQAPVQVMQKSHYILYVKRQPVIAAIESISESTKELFTENETLIVSDSLLQIKKNFIGNILLNKEIKLYLDVTGKVAYSESINSQSKNYAYLIGIGYENSLENSLIVKIFTKEGEIKVLPLASKVKIDSIYHTTTGSAETALKKRPSGSTTSSVSRPIIFKENSKGEITEIETDTPNYSLNTGEYTPYTTQTHIKYSIDEISDSNAFKAAYRTFRLTEYKESTASFDGKFIITSDTLILGVPDIDMYGIDRGIEFSADQPATSALTLTPALAKLYEYPIEDKYYRILSIDSLSNVYSYDVQAYDVDADTGIAGLVVIRGNSDTTYYGNVPYNSSFKMAVYLKTTEAYDEETQTIQTKVYWTTDGENIESAIVNKDELLYSYKYLFDGCSTNHTDNTVNGVPPCEIYQAFKGASNYSKEPVEALAPGDIVRIMTKKGKLSHIERVVNLSKIDNTVCTNLYPTNLRYPYSPNLSGINANSETYGMPNDVRAYWAGPNNTYSITLAKPNSLSSSMVRCIIGQKKFTDINLSNPSTYQEAYLDLSSAPIVHVKLLKNGTVKAEKSDISCIKTYQETGNLNSVTNFVMKSADYKVEQLFVIETEV